MLEYPQNLDYNNSPFLEIYCRDWSTKGKRNQNTTITKSTIESIFLPVPKNGLSENISNNWSEADGVTYQANTKGAVDAAITLIGKKLSEATGPLSQYTSFQKGQILNDYSALNFTGNNFREFSMTYDMYPSSEEEADAIKKIVKAFKTNSLPKYENSIVRYPRFWDITLHIPNGETPIRFLNCVLTEVSAEYFQDDNVSVYEDGNVNVNLVLNFRELTRLSRDSFKDEGYV